MTPTARELVRDGWHHLSGPYWSDSRTGRTWHLVGNTWALTSHDEIGALTVHLAQEQLAGRRDGIYCPGCEGCEEGKAANGEEVPQ